MRGLFRLPKGMQGLDSGQPWFLYWLSEALEVFDVKGCEMSPEMKSAGVRFLARCQNPDEGGFGGAPFHMSHIASSYAAILAMVNLGTEEAFKMVDVEGMRRFLLSVKNNYTFTDPSANSGWAHTNPKTGAEVKPRGCSDVVASLPGSLVIH
jgi:protein farnesyltransferase subunit beta